MRYALPIWWCITEDARDRLRPFLSSKWQEPDCEWVEWFPDKRPVDIDRGIDYDKFIRQSPSRSRL